MLAALYFFTLLSINLNSLVCFSLYYASANIDLFFLYCCRPQFGNQLPGTILKACANTKRHQMHWSMSGIDELYFLHGFCVL